MLVRIAVLGDIAPVQKAFMGQSDLLLSRVEANDPLPAATAAIVTESKSAKGAAALVTGIRENYLNTLLLLVEAIDAREGVTASGTRILDYATRFAAALQLSPEETSTLQRGALLRDIGKIRISNEVLLKKSVLDYDEWVSLQRHTTYGAELLQEAGLHTDILDIVRYHHESYDGTGYPEGLERDGIPRLAQATKILDVYCAMTSPRHYRKNIHTHESVAAHLQSERGKHFHPELLDTFLSSI